MNTLAIESATECLSVALAVGADVRERQLLEPRAHATRILPWTRELLGEAGLSFAQIDRLAVSRGPGGFTSLRIGLAIVQGLALAHDRPVHPISSLSTLAQAARGQLDGPFVLAALDARRDEIYAAWYRLTPTVPLRLGDELLASPERLHCPRPADWQAIGPGVIAHRQRLAQRLGRSVRLPEPEASVVWPRASALLELVDHVKAVAADQITPTYLRDQVTD